MNDTSMTTKKVKEINKNKVYRFLYDAKTSCKQEMTHQLQMGLSTVTQNLKILEDEGLICKNGFYDSTGGRKAEALEIVADAKISIGVAVLKNMIHVVATDLYGRLISGSTFPLPFVHQPEYYQKIGYSIQAFLAQHNLDSGSVLGVSVATQGIIAKDGESVSYGAILGNGEVRRSHFQEHIPFPCRLEHDSKAAARLELWNHPEVEDGVVLLLNRNMGGAIIMNGAVQNGSHMRSGTIEHMHLPDNEGAMCYCGRRGCLETVCSMGSLEAKVGMEMHHFFQAIEEDNEEYKAIWEGYLHHLAVAIANLSVVVDGNFILSGYLAPYFKEAYIQYLLDAVNEIATFPVEREQIVVGASGQFTQAMGTSLAYTEVFLKQV